jgi:DNA replication protein DnaC
VRGVQLIEDLRKAYNKQRLDRRLRIYRAPKVLIIDEIGSTLLHDSHIPAPGEETGGTAI